jgi:hypothetical protein
MDLPTPKKVQKKPVFKGKTQKRENPPGEKKFFFDHKPNMVMTHAEHDGERIFHFGDSHCNFALREPYKKSFFFMKLAFLL